MTLAEIRNAIRRYLRDEDNVWVSDLILNEIINRAYEFIARDGMLLRGTVTLTVPDTGIVTLPSNIFHINRIYFNNKPLPRVSLKDLDSYFPNWQTTTSTAPQYWAFRDPVTLVFYPKPAATTSFSVSVDGFFVPKAGDTLFPTLSADTDEPKIPLALHMALVYRALLELAMRYPENPGLQVRAQTAAAQLPIFYQQIALHYRHPIEGVLENITMPSTEGSERK